MTNPDKSDMMSAQDKDQKGIDDGERRVNIAREQSCGESKIYIRMETEPLFSLVRKMVYDLFLIFRWAFWCCPIALFCGIYFMAARGLDAKHYRRRKSNMPCYSEILDSPDTPNASDVLCADKEVCGGDNRGGAVQKESRAIRRGQEMISKQIEPNKKYYAYFDIKEAKPTIRLIVKADKSVQFYFMDAYQVERYEKEHSDYSWAKAVIGGRFVYDGIVELPRQDRYALIFDNKSNEYVAVYYEVLI